MDFRLSDEQRRMVDTLRKFRRDVLEPNAITYLDGTFPHENMARLAELGILGMAVPQEYGGSGLGVLDTVLALEEIGKACYVTAMAALGEVGVQTRIISTFAPESLKRQYLRRGRHVSLADLLQHCRAPEPRAAMLRAAPPCRGCSSASLSFVSCRRP